MKLKTIGERNVISELRRRFPARAKGLLLGIGDDAAVFRGAGNIFITKDLLVEEYDFVKDFHPPRLLGRKSLIVNLSDIAAMGGRPLYALVGLGAPGHTDWKWIKEFLAGLASAARQSGTALIGGDLSEASGIVISITVIGEGKTFVTRGGARPGDRIYVSGTLGDAAQGLQLLLKGERRGKDRKNASLLKAFLDPSPRLELGPIVARQKLASAMVDLSDGLSVDLAHVCRESGAGAEIELEKLPLSRSLLRVADQPLELALHGGEDFELLFTVKAGNLARIDKLREKFKITAIGRITEKKTLVTVDAKGKRKPLRAQGYEHFRK